MSAWRQANAAMPENPFASVAGMALLTAEAKNKAERIREYVQHGWFKLEGTKRNPVPSDTLISVIAGQHLAMAKSGYAVGMQDAIHFLETLGMPRVAAPLRERIAKLTTRIDRLKAATAGA